MVSDKLKKIIFNELYHQLGKAEIIPYLDSIYFIDRENKYWYLEFGKDGTLFWRYTFFQQFFQLFSLDHPVYVEIISEWVEEVLNCRVKTIAILGYQNRYLVEEALNCKVKTIYRVYAKNIDELNEVLNYKVTSTEEPRWNSEVQADMILNHKVSSIGDVVSCIKKEAEEVLKHTMSLALKSGCEGSQVEEVLNYKVLSTNAMGAWHPVPEELVLNYKVSSSRANNLYTDFIVEDILDSKTD